MYTCTPVGVRLHGHVHLICVCAGASALCPSFSYRPFPTRLTAWQPVVVQARSLTPIRLSTDRSAKPRRGRRAGRDRGAEGPQGGPRCRRGGARQGPGAPREGGLTELWSYLPYQNHVDEGSRVQTLQAHFVVNGYVMRILVL